MTSSMLAGERRWASARRGGMTVLGKVAVPKPINLPSQRLENHGLDPNVDIVPKGSLSWGSRPSSSASNPWGSSVPSLSGDCSNGSPSHAGGRPSSGGSGTRPSTAGSDRMHEPVPTARGSNSRPSSASGVLTSNQTPLAPLRPQSAETRPGSSNLSRFAEQMPDSSGAWGSTGNAEKMIVASTKSDGFSLSSGDFPTLGSEKDISGKKPDLHEYGSHDRPRSLSDSAAAAAAADDGTIASESDMKGGNAHTWKRDESQHMEDGVDHNSNNWHGGYPQQFLNTNVPPQHFDAWRGPPVNSPAGIWYRGPPGGSPYGPHVPPGGFPLEPFPYYRPHMPPHALGNSQPVPQQVPVGGPRGHHPKSGEPFRPQIPDGYMHPGMPVRPGFYPRPVPYDNYFGAPMGYNPNERDIPFMGMPAAPPVFNRYPAQNAPDRNTHTKAGRRGPNATNSPSEQAESGNSDRGPYKVLMKQHNDLDAQGEEGSWENTSPGNVSFPETGGQPSATFRKNEWGTEGRRQEMHSRRPAFGDYSASRKFDNRGHPVHTARVMSPERIDHVDRDWGKKSDTASVMSPFPDAVHVPKHSALLQKIEGLNAKARASDSRRDPASASFREEQHDVAQYDAISKTCKNDVGTAALCAERPNSRDSIHSSGEVPVSRGHLIHQSNAGITNSRRANNGAESQFEHRGKGRSNTDADGWRKKPNVTECVTAIPTTNVVPIPIGHNKDNHIHSEVYATTEPSFPADNDGESSTQIHDTSDTQAQRAKMRELAKQRAIQLQKEEEERIKEQKAKALAKLEELNRRSQSGDVLTEKSEKTPPHSGMIVSQEEEWQTLAEPVKYALKSEAPNQIMTSSSDIVGSAIESCTSRVAESTVLSKNMHTDTSDIAEQVTAAPLSSPLKQDSAGAGDVKAVVRGPDLSIKSNTGYKSTQNVQVEHQFAESLISFGTIGLTNIHGSGAVEGTAFLETVSEAILPGPQSTISKNSNTVRELSAAQKKKNTNTGKNKNKPESPLPVSDSQVQVSRHPDFSKMEASQSKVDPGSVQAMKEDLERLAGQHSVINEESQVKVDNYLKSQPPRRMSRNGQATKVADKSHGNDAATWAPVRSHHRAEAEDGADRKAAPDSVAVSAKSSGNFVQNSGKSKRAEMERYVPKPVAKELAQQGTVQQSSSVAQNTLNETVGGRESSFQESSQATRSVVENVRPTVQSNTGVSKQGKQTKAYGGWKQRGSTESSRVHMGSSSNSSTNNKNMDQQESFIPEEHQVIAETNVSHVWDPSDGWNMPEEPTAAVNVSFGVKDQVVVKGKGKRQPYKGHKIISSKHDVDQKNSNGGEMYKKQIQSPSLEISQPERTIGAKENRGSGERSSSLWQPKPQVYTAYAQTGSSSSGGQHVSSEAGWGTKEDYSRVIRDASVTLNEDHTEVIPQTHTGHLQSKNKSVRQSTNVVHQGRREKKVASDKEPPQPYHKHGLGGMDEQAPPESGDTYYEQRSSSGFRKHGNQNNRSGRVQESREDWSSLEQDARHRNVPGNRERQQRNSHYEYQPVRSHNHNKSNNFEGPYASHDMSSRYRERGQGQSRRGGGNSYG